MPDFEFEFNQQDRDLILSQASSNLSNNDYVRLTIYPQETDNIVRLVDTQEGIDGRAIFFSSTSYQSVDISPFSDTSPRKFIGTEFLNDFKIYKNGDNIFIKPNEIFNKYGLPQGNYRIQIDFLRQVVPQLDIVGVAPLDLGGALAAGPLPNYYTIPEDTGFEIIGAGSSLQAAAAIFGGNEDDYQITTPVGQVDYTNSSGTLFNFITYPVLKKDETFLEFFDAEDLNSPFKFIIKQISTSRKEVRLKLLNFKLSQDSSIIRGLINEFNDYQNEFLDETDEQGNLLPNPNYKYQFKHILNIGTGNHVPIVNYTFDEITDGKNNQSIILKLYEPLPTNISNLSKVTIEREVLTTQVQDIFYFSDVPDVFFGDGLVPDVQENWISPDNNQHGFQSLDEIAISQSIGDIEVNSLISSSEYGYPNLNIDFNEFSNHTHFGSAKKKLQNFKTKVETIQGHYSEISGTLSVSSSIIGDSFFIKQKRLTLFNKIQDEFKNFTPYERFLYFDAQTDSTASAPSLKNYADTIPVVFGGEGVELNQHNGFNVVYKHSSEKVSGVHDEVIDLFTDKYLVQNKPFFNYSSSIYLSFLLQGDSGSSLQWSNNNIKLTPPFPQDALYQNNILNPEMTGSQYQRYVFQASQSYFIPNTTNNDLADLSEADGDFDVGSSKITMLHSGTKTGSYKIKDSTNKYPTTVVSQSGVPFFGSVMPGGELFRIFYENNLSASLFAHYNYENITIDDKDFEVLDVSGNNRTISWDGGSTLSFTSASVETGVDGKISSSLKWSGSGAPDSSPTGLMYFNSNIDNEAGRVTFTTSSGVDQGFDGFTFTSWLKTEDTTITIMSLDIKSSGSALRDNVAVNNSSLEDVDGWWLGKSGGAIQGQVTDQGHKVLNKSDFTANPSNADLTDNEFHHYALSWNQTTGTGSLYVDGVNVKTVAGYPLSGSNVIYRIRVGNGPGSALGYGDGQFDETRFYLRSLNDSEINQLFLHPDGKTETKITDVKLTLKDPTDVLPFDNIFKTTSTEFTNWYNDALTKAETFDTNNIHSFENNLPLYIQESSDYNDMKDFLNLQGEQYDLIRNHIDSMGTIHNRGYKKTNSPPNNTLPMLLSNMGWEAINPFSGSLTDTLGSYLSGITSIDDIKNNTWRKTLNNLLYIYKSKGTKNSVRALLNVYGYPPDVLEFQEFGGTTSTGDSSEVFTDTPPVPVSSPDSPIVDTDLINTTSSISFTTNKQTLYRYIFNANQDRILNLDWYYNNANINTIEFVYKHVETKNTQTILKSSGSVNETLWDLRLLPSSTGNSSSFEFRLNNSQNADTSIGSRGFSMSLAYDRMTDGQLWNVMLQRMTGSTNGAGIIEYRLHSALQKENKISNYNYVTMSVSGGIEGGSTLGGKGFFANENFQSSGSRGSTSSSNLVVGETISGSLAEIRGWSTALSTSKFRQHVLNKNSTVGNTILSHCHELVYHFKLNENYNSSSISSSNQFLKIVDASPQINYSDYSIQKSGSFFSNSTIYGFDFIDVNRLTLLDNNSTKNNDNSILINPQTDVLGNLNSNVSPINSLTNNIGKKPKLITSTKLELYRSPQTFINNFISDKLSGFNLETKYANPNNFYSQSYKELDDFRKDFFICYPVKYDINKFIRSQESMFNNSIAEGLKSLVPGRSTFGEKGDFGVEIKPTILEKQKYENEHHSIEINPNTFTSSISPSPDLSTSEFIQPKLGSVNVNVTNTSTYEQPKSASIGIEVTNTSTYESPKLGSITTLPLLTDSSVPTSKDGNIDYASRANQSYSDVHKNWGRTDSDVQHINFAAPTGSDGTFNTYDIDTRFVFNAIGDCEYYSASFNNTVSGAGSSNFTNINNFYNHLQITDGPAKNVFYTHLKAVSRVINVAHNSGKDNTFNGKRMGKTRFMREFVDNDGSFQLALPSNHVTKFSQPFKEQMIGGAQNTNPGFLNVQHEDYSSASFYRVKVTGGENQIYVKGTSNPTKDETDDRIIY